MTWNVNLLKYRDILLNIILHQVIEWHVEYALHIVASSLNGSGNKLNIHQAVKARL